MDDTRYARAISTLIPDVLNSLDASVEDGPEGKDRLSLLRSLKDAVECVQDALESNGDNIHTGVLKTLDDGVECCRMLASALSLGALSDAEEVGQSGTSPQPPRQSHTATLITNRVTETMDFLCEASLLKSTSDQEALLQETRSQQSIGDISKYYESITLLLHNKVSEGDKTASTIPWGVQNIRSDPVPTPTQLGSKFGDVGRNLKRSISRTQGSQAARISLSIDEQIHNEQVKPWTRSDALLAPTSPQQLSVFRASLAALACENSQTNAQLRKAAARRTASLLETFFYVGRGSSIQRSMKAIPEEDLERGRKLQAQLDAADGEFPDEALDCFEYLWSLERFSSPITNGGKDYETANRVLGNLRLYLQDDSLLTHDDIAWTFRQSWAERLTEVRYNGRQVDIVDVRTSHALLKRMKLNFREVPTVLFVWDLTLYNECYDGLPEYTLFDDALQFFERLMNDSLADGPHFHKTTFLLFLFGVTEFGEKLTTIPLSRHAPGFMGDSNNTAEAAAYILGQFAAKAEFRGRFRARVCDLDDAGNLEFLFASVDHVMRQRAIVESARRGGG